MLDKMIILDTLQEGLKARIKLEIFISGLVLYA